MLFVVFYLSFSSSFVPMYDLVPSKPVKNHILIYQTTMYLPLIFVFTTLSLFLFLFLPRVSTGFHQYRPW